MPTGQEIRFAATDDGVSLAYAVTGSGPPLVKAANWLSHLEYDWDSPVWRPYLETFASRFTYVRYDARGTGLSDADISGLSFDDLVADLEAVVDAAGVERFPLLGISQGGAVATTYAVRHPERVSHLILLGAYAQGRKMRGDPESREQYELYKGLVRQGWGTDDPAYRHVFTSQFIPGGTSRQHDWFDELMRRSASGDNALALFEVLADIDVTDLAPRVTAPTLILHAAGDRRVPFEQGRLFARLIPGARFVQLDTDNHLPLGSEPAWDRFIRELLTFVGIDVPDHVDEGRSAAALLMTDIVDSTRLADAIGEAAWKQLIQWHDQEMETAIASGGGRMLNNTGDGFLAAFDDEVSAVACAVDIQRRLADHRSRAGFAPSVRIGVHSGDYARLEDGVGGIEVHKTARVASAAGADEVLVSLRVAEQTAERFSYGASRRIAAKGIEGGLEVRDLHWR